MRIQPAPRPIRPLLAAALLALPAALPAAGFDLEAAHAAYDAAPDKQAFLANVPQDDPAAAGFVNSRRGLLAAAQKDHAAAAVFYKAAFEAGRQGSLPRLLRNARLSGDLRAALELEAQLETLPSPALRARGFYEIALCKPDAEINACLLKAARSGRIPAGQGSIAFVSRLLAAYRFHEATPRQALEFLDAVDLMLEDTAETAAITGKIIDMKNEQRRREQ